MESGNSNGEIAVCEEAISMEENMEEAGAHQLYSISFHDITYEVKQRHYCRRVKNKVILNSVSGLMTPGLNAIMGPTGSGKTSLLDVLSSRKHGEFLSGSVLINCKQNPTNFRSLVGYVVQDDVVLGTLTVRENLLFSAALRLPGKTSWKERKERVDNIIAELGLQSCAYTKVGNELIRGVSGGERKRTNIGMELITEPQILFLDEPTSGLDAYTAVSVVQLLKSLSKVKGRTVIMSIHQPRYSIFKLFDSLTLLSKGNIVYQGPSKDTLAYFSKIGFQCEAHENPADFFLDTLNRLQNEQVAIDGGMKSFPDVYKGSNEFQTLKAEIHPFLGIEQDSIHNSHSCLPSYPTSFIWQFLMVALRSGVNLFRNPGTSIAQYSTVIFFALVIGGVYFQLDTDAPGFQDRIGALFFLCGNLAFGSLPSIELFIKERELFIHEYASGYYAVFPFFAAKVVMDVIMFRFIPNIFYIVITFFMIGFRITAGQFFIYALILMLCNIASTSLAFCISAFTRVEAVANVLVSAVFFFSVFFGGQFIALNSIPDWIGWLRFLSFMRYSVEGLSINEIDGLQFECFESSANSTDMMMMMTNETCTFDGLTRLQELGFETGWLWYDVLALVIFSLLFFTLTYIILSLIKKEK